MVSFHPSKSPHLMFLGFHYVSTLSFGFIFGYGRGHVLTRLSLVLLDGLIGHYYRHVYYGCLTILVIGW